MLRATVGTRCNVAPATLSPVPPIPFSLSEGFEFIFIFKSSETERGATGATEVQCCTCCTFASAIRFSIRPFFFHGNVVRLLKGTTLAPAGELLHLWYGSGIIGRCKRCNSGHQLGCRVGRQRRDDGA